MENRQFIRKVYRNFSDFVSISASRELEFLVLDSKFKKDFNLHMRKLFREIKEAKEETIEFTMFFSEAGEVVLVDSSILGKYIADSYKITMEGYYKNASLNKIAKEIVNGSSKSKEDFIKITYRCIYGTLITMYEEIKYRKDILEKLKLNFEIPYYEEEDLPVVMISLQITEDICKYLKLCMCHVNEIIPLDTKKDSSK